MDVDGLAAVSINGSLYTTLETLIPILTDSPFDDMDSNSGVGNTVPVAESSLDVINLALAAIEVQANALPPPPMDLYSPHTDLLWAMNATTRQLDAAADSGNFDAATTRMFRQTSQTRSNAAHDWEIFSGTAQGVTFIAQPEAMLFKGAAAGLIGLKVLGRAEGFVDDALRFSTPKSGLGMQSAEYRYFRSQGLTASQSKYLIEPYPESGMGHHFIGRQHSASRGGWVPDAIVESPLNIMGRGMSRGRFYVRHFKGDPYFYGTKFPKRVGGNWSSFELGLEKTYRPFNLWHAAPYWFRNTGVGAAGAGAAWGTYELLDDE